MRVLTKKMTKAEDIIRTIARIISPVTAAAHTMATNKQERERVTKGLAKGAKIAAHTAKKAVGGRRAHHTTKPVHHKRK